MKEFLPVYRWKKIWIGFWRRFLQQIKGEVGYRYFLCLGSWPGLKESPWFWMIDRLKILPKSMPSCFISIEIWEFIPRKGGKGSEHRTAKATILEVPNKPFRVAQRPTFRPLKAARSKKLCWALGKRPWSIWTQTPGPEWWRQAGQKRTENQRTLWLHWTIKTKQMVVASFFQKKHLSLCLGREVYFTRIASDWPVKPLGNHMDETPELTFWRRFQRLEWEWVNCSRKVVSRSLFGHSYG